MEKTLRPIESIVPELNLDFSVTAIRIDSI